MLVVFLALLLGLSPLQGVMAGLLSSVEQEGRMHHQMSDTGCDMHMENDHAAQSGNQCDTRSDCTDHNCASGHCASCVLAVIPHFSSFSSLRNTPEFSRTREKFVDQLSTSLFRPPRA